MGRDVAALGTKEFDLTDPKAVVVASHNGLLALLRLMDAMKSTPNGIKAKVEMGTVDTRTSGVAVVRPEKAYQIGGIKDTVITLTSISMISGFNLVNSPYRNANLYKNKAYVDLLTIWAKLPKTGPNPPTTEQISDSLVRNMDIQIFRILTKEEESKKEEFKKEFKLSEYIGVDKLSNLIKSSFNKKVGEVQSSLDEVLNVIRPAYIKMYSDFTLKYYPDNATELVENMNSKLNDKARYTLKDQVIFYSRTDDNYKIGSTTAAQNTSTKTVQSREIGK
jgi:hypothetical protein